MQTRCRPVHPKRMQAKEKRKADTLSVATQNVLQNEKRKKTTDEEREGERENKEARELPLPKKNLTAKARFFLQVKARKEPCAICKKLYKEFYDCNVEPFSYHCAKCHEKYAHADADGDGREVEF